VATRKTKTEETPVPVAENGHDENGAAEMAATVEKEVVLSSEPPDTTIREGVWVDINRLSIDEWEEMEAVREEMGENARNDDMRRRLRSYIEKSIVIDEAKADPPVLGMRDFLKAFWRFLDSWIWESLYQKN